MGNMKAKEVAIVVGSVRYNGFTFKVTAYDKDKIISRICKAVFLNNSRNTEEKRTISAKTGVIIVAVAVLLAISVKAAVMMHRTSAKITGSKS